MYNMSRTLPANNARSNIFGASSLYADAVTGFQGQHLLNNFKDSLYNICIYLQTKDKKDSPVTIVIERSKPAIIDKRQRMHSTEVFIAWISLQKHQRC